MSAQIGSGSDAREMIFQNIDAPGTLIVAEAAQENQATILCFRVL
jgi:hypothetical protein